MSNTKSREETPEEKERGDKFWRTLGKLVRSGSKIREHSPGPDPISGS
jgi:hypothetical protein